MKRKVVLHGPSTLTISLPTKWVHAHGVQKGDELEVIENRESLTISTDKQSIPVKRTKLNLVGVSPDSVLSSVAVMHKSGFDEVEVSFDSPVTLKVIQDVIQSTLIGYEIIEQHKNGCLIKSISSQESQEYSNVVRRNFLVALTLARNAREAIATGQFDDLADILVLEQTNNRLTNFCHRILNKQVHSEDKIAYQYVILWILENICDDYKRIAHLFISEKYDEVDEYVADCFKVLAELLEEFYKLYYKFSTQGLDAYRKKLDAFDKEINTYLSDAKHQINLLVQVYNINLRMKESLGSLAGIHH